MGASVSAQVPDWYVKLTTIKPRVSSRTDVERLFDGLKVRETFVYKGVEVVSYDWRHGRLTMDYATGDCPVDRKERCGFGKDIVLEGLLSLTAAVKFSKFRLKKEALYAFWEDDNPTLHYFDIKAGLNHAVQNKRVISVSIFHPSMYKQAERLARTGDP